MDWVTLLLFIVGGLLGYGVFKIFPTLITLLANLLVFMLFTGIVLTAVFSNAGLLNFFITNPVVSRITQFLLGYVVGSVLSLKT